MKTRRCSFVLVTLVLAGANLAHAQDWRASPEPVRQFKLVPASMSEVVETIEAPPSPVTPSADAKSVPQHLEANPAHVEVVSGWKSAVPHCGCIRRTWQWLTYRALPNSCSLHCHIVPNPWGLPSLYIFFPCNQHGSGACNLCASSSVACGSAVPDPTEIAPLDH